jgi:biotin transport system substrate-specific component
MAVTGLGWGQALAVGAVPFLPGDIAKIIAAVLLAPSLRRLMGDLAPRGRHPAAAPPDNQPLSTP